MGLREEIISDAGSAFNEVRTDLAASVRMFLLRRAGETQRFAVVAEITDGHWSRWDTFREQTTFIWASSDAEWTDLVAQTSHVGFGVLDDLGQIDVFVISPDQRDRVPPSGGNLLWKLYGSRDGTLRFQLPDSP